VTAATKIKIEKPLANSRILLDWDRRSRKQIEEAKEVYRQARREGRLILDRDENPVTAFRSDHETLIIAETELDAEQFAIHVLDKTGDRRLIWNSNRPEEVDEAKKLFEEYVKKGWKAYGVRKDGSKSFRVRAFNAESEEVYFDDKKESVGTKFKDFIAAFREVKMLSFTQRADSIWVAKMKLEVKD
jgi:hypothetical protein